MSQIIREIQIKATVRSHLTPVKMASINKSTNQGGQEKGTLVHCWWECRLVQPLWKTVWRFLKILKMEQHYDSVIPCLGIYPKKPKTLIPKNIRTPMLIAALFTIARIWKQPKCPSTDERMKKWCFIYTTEYNLAVKKNEILPL